MITGMREVRSTADTEAGTFAACVATILELPLEVVPQSPPGEEVTGWRLSRWLGGLGLGLVPIADPAGFSWPGPWIGCGRAPGERERRAVVMYGVPSGLVFDPRGGTQAEGWALEQGFVIAASDIALARPEPSTAPAATGRVEAIFVSPTAGAPSRSLESVQATGSGLDGDRHVDGRGTFPSGLPGSALTLIEDEVCASFSPPLAADEHRRNLVTRGIDLNALVGHDFTIGEVSCRGMRLCEPCTVVDGYASRPVLRPLVHRGGLRADILHDGTIRVGDPIRAKLTESTPRADTMGE
jgi:hypothetical protein